MMKDPQGAAFYIIQPEPPREPARRRPEVGEASWLELMTTDAPAAMKFYHDSLAGSPARRWIWERWASTRCSIAATA